MQVWLHRLQHAKGVGVLKLPDLDLKDMALATALADSRHLGAAARHVGLSVSAASHRLAQLEGRLGVPLFHRTPAGMELTDQGTRFVPEARRALDAAEAAAASVRSEHPVVRVGSAWLMATTWLPPLLASLAHVHPDQMVEMATGRSREVARWVEEGRVRVGLVRATEARPGVRAFVVGADPVVLVAPVGHRWLRDPPLPEDLDRVPFVDVSPDTGFGQFVAEAQRDLGIHWPTAVRVDHLEAALALVEAGVGPAVLPFSLVHRRGGAEVAPVAVSGLMWPRRPLALVIRAGDALPPWAVAWPALLRSVVQRQG
jgi:DNA-binding transcriptional LysR family regulator